MDVRKLPLDERAQCAAYLRAVHNMSQMEIGEALGGLSQPHVSRLLSHAEKKKYLVIQQRFASELFSDEWIKSLQGLLAPSGLSEDLKAYCESIDVIPPRVQVFDSGPGRTEVALTQRRTRFGRVAGGRLIELIERSKVVGVAWGRTLQAVIEGISSSRQPLEGAQKIEFVAVCAELVSLTQRGYSSSRLAEDLDEIFNAEPTETPHLTGFPAYIPRHYDAEMREAIWKFVTDVPGHHRIFSGPDALIDQMDLLISSVGASSDPVRGSFDDLAQASGLRPSDLRGLLVGDLGGVLIPRSGLSAAKERTVEELNHMWTGMKSEHVQALARRAAEDTDIAGVVVLALQAERGDTAFELINRGLVNELILDHAAAAQLHKRARAALDGNAD